jgi:hypothetical protein
MTVHPPSERCSLYLHIMSLAAEANAIAQERAASEDLRRRYRLAITYMAVQREWQLAYERHAASRCPLHG